jgi:glycosyltransferase involved in cell wall biosynthesis
MRIVQVPRRFVATDWGGTESVILETSRCLARLGHDNHIACPNALAASNDDTIAGVKVHRTSYFYPYLGLDAVAKRRLDQKGGNLFSFELWRYLESLEGLEILHLHTMKRLGGIVRRVALKRGIPYVVSLHGGMLDVPATEAASWTEPTKGKLEWGKLLGYWVGSRRVLDDAAAIICVGAEEQRKIAASYPGKPVIHLPNGVDLPRFAEGDGSAFRAKFGIPPDRRVVTVVGRIDPQKNQKLAVEVLERLLPHHADLHLVLVGHVTNDAYRADLQAMIAKSGISDHVTLIPGLPGQGKELVDAYHGSDVFLLPSIHEPFGIVILEAWASGLPVVASRVGGIPSFVEDGRDGLLFESNNASDLAERLTEVLSDGDRAASLATSGQQKALRDYSWDSITRQLVEIYEEAMRANPLRK